ncbi:paraquat-inducible protein A [Moritella yayanosii]|uniref:Paraquat-inducible membrane protein A n=1 Tax=Moritella yayanosii TaxID=69539 RepID=A0A330LLA5_9GAMM|nr:paraquat-inducible protein A [Moritella yayanosii]SQD77429.1 Paraquat-inducible membrane protein A [Moritella yayanosii]
MQNAKDNKIAKCQECSLLISVEQDVKQQRCPRCFTRVHFRIPRSIQKTWALLITAAFMMIPANILPISTLTSTGKTTPDTIMSGTIALAKSDNLGIAIIIFIASILVPLFKIIGLILILLSVQNKIFIAPKRKLLLFNAIHWIGKWSFMDLFVISIMVAVINRGNLLSVDPGYGATCFGLVVVLTILATESFDTRLIWDLNHKNERK